MKGLRLAVIAGTSEATDLIAVLPEQDCVTAFAATEYGKTILEGQHCTVRVGRLDADGFRFALRGMDAVIDASHPLHRWLRKRCGRSAQNWNCRISGWDGRR